MEGYAGWKDTQDGETPQFGGCNRAPAIDCFLYYFLYPEHPFILTIQIQTMCTTNKHLHSEAVRCQSMIH
jgi:hypothetical protein